MPASREERNQARRVRRLEDRIYAAQERYIRDNFGKRAAARANYGWGVSDDYGGEFLSVATKVYGYGVLQTEGSTFSRSIDHDFQPFDRTR